MVVPWVACVPGDILGWLVGAVGWGSGGTLHGGCPDELAGADMAVGQGSRGLSAQSVPGRIAIPGMGVGQDGSRIQCTKGVLAGRLEPKQP